MSLTETIKGFAALGNDWDSYGAGPISPAVIACALETAAALHAGGWTVVPCGDGTIMFIRYDENDEKQTITVWAE